MWVVGIVLVAVTALNVTVRIATDVPNIQSGVVPPSTELAHGYARYPLLAYAHILPGLLFMVGGGLQFVGRLRRRYPRFHRWLGRVLVAAGLTTGALAVAYGVLVPYGGTLEAAATVVFGAAFIVAIVRGLLHARRRDFAKHREWMIRAYAIGLGVSTIRIWIGLLESLTGKTLQQVMGAAFWLGFLTHAAAAELWLRSSRRPPKPSH
jgi:hypothetical protein